MRRIVRRTATIVTVQTWTVTWTEQVPVGEPSPAEPLPALPPGPAPDSHEAAEAESEKPRTEPGQAGNAG